MWKVVLSRIALNLHRKISVRSFSSSPTGLYGIPYLHTPKGFRPFADEAIQRCGELVRSITSTMNLPPAEVMRIMDEISDTVCSVVDSADLCRQTHPNREFVVEATNASLRMNDYIHYLNTHIALCDAVKKAEQECHMLSEEAQRGLRNLRVDFERAGYNICPEKLERVNKLNIENSQLCREDGWNVDALFDMLAFGSIRYLENIEEDPGIVDIYPSSHIPKYLHYLGKPIHRSKSLIRRVLSGSRETVKEKGFRIATDPQTVTTMLTLSPDEEVRKMVYIQGNSAPRANVDVLKRLISARHELAQIMGYRSYADFTVKLNMASSPKVVISFLLEMSKVVQAKAKEERELLTKYKRENCRQSDVDFRPWDEPYYMTRMKSSLYNLDSSLVESYFSLSNCIEGFKVLVQSLFGATFHNIPLAPGESWDPQVLKLSLHHPEEGDLGYMYLDLYSRKGKFPGCAHFAIKGGRRISQTEYQLPIVALVCNFPAKRNPSAVRLNPWELETLFHEFGHALHSLLSRTEYHHHSGTRTVLDFAELPSHLFEYYAWDYRVLKRFARHYSTGEEIPQKLVESMKGARDMFAATELQRQIFYAIVDQTLFGEQPLPLGDIGAVVAELQREHTNWERVEGTHWETRFSHFVNYGAGYYSYIYCKCFAANIWKTVCKEDPLSLTTGSTLRTKFLQHGGAKDPAAVLNDLAGDRIYKYYDGGIIPDLSSLCEEMKLIEEHQQQVLSL